ncbi:pali-domain-containing protein [Mycena sanguinolenta]|nr:pali-domain-containing protein [Mycena sanguinolenta]
MSTPTTRAFYLSGIALLGLALILSVAISISLPTFSGLDFVRVNFPNAPPSADIMSQLRFGIWAPCSYDGNWKRTCLSGGHGYALEILSFDKKQSVFIGSSWTRGLAIHPVATGVIAVALGAACSKHEYGPLIATFASFLAAFLMLLAFIVDIALYAFVKQKVDTLPNGNTVTGAAFWMAFVSLILVLLSGFTVFFGRRKEVGADYPSLSSSKGGILSRFRKN